MPDQEQSAVFGQERASSYDKQRSKLAPLRDALHLLTGMVFADLPDDARILCVGVGTGAELFDLAEARPRWRFTALDPAAAMLDKCRERAEQTGITARCTFHEGYLGSLPDSDPFDAATCMLVSHFILQPDERRKFYQEIAARLRPDGLLVNADLASDLSTPASGSMLDVWQRMHEHAGMPFDRAGFDRKVSVLPPPQVEAILASSGFASPVLFYQALFIHAWY